MFGPTHALLGYLVAYFAVRNSKSIDFRDGVFALACGIAPDIDFLSPLPFGTPFGHHGLAHSPLLLLTISSPFLVKRRSNALPYSLALVSHVVSDFVDNTIPLFGPLSWGEFGLRLSYQEQLVPLALSIELIICFAFICLVIRRPNDLPISIPEKYDKLATSSLMMMLLAGPIVSWYLASSFQISVTLPQAFVWASSSVLVLYSIACNSYLILGAISSGVKERKRS